MDIEVLKAASKALKPFADYANNPDEVKPRITDGDLRRAAEAYAALEAAPIQPVPAEVEAMAKRLDKVAEFGGTHLDGLWTEAAAMLRSLASPVTAVDRNAVLEEAKNAAGVIRAFQENAQHDEEVAGNMKGADQYYWGAKIAKAIEDKIERLKSTPPEAVKDDAP